MLDIQDDLNLFVFYDNKQEDEVVNMMHHDKFSENLVKSSWFISAQICLFRFAAEDNKMYTKLMTLHVMLYKYALLDQQRQEQIVFI